MDNTFDSKYAKFHKLRRLGMPDENVRQAMIFSGLAGDNDFAAVFADSQQPALPEPNADADVGTDPKYAKFLMTRRLGISDEGVRQSMFLSDLTKGSDFEAVLSSGRHITETGLDLDKSLMAYYSKEAHMSGNTHLSDPLLMSMLCSWNTRSAGSPPEEEDTCQICFDSIPQSQLIRKCQLGVPYCKGCVASFLEGDIREARLSEEGCACLCRSCDSKFSEEEIGQLVAPDILQKFITFRNAKLVETNPLKVYCPSPACASVVTLTAEGATRAKCQTCSTKFCVKCGGEHGAFVTCEWAADSGFRKWKGSTPDGCKRCPNCRLFIEKNGGCSHMTCQHCHHGFCWHCMSNWYGGCSAGRFCTPLRVIRSDVWGSIPVLRESAQAVGITAGVGVGLGLAGAAVAAAAAAAALVVGVGTPLALVGGPLYGAYKGAKKLKKSYLRKKRLQARQNGPRLELDDEDYNDLRNELKWGVRVYFEVSSLSGQGLSADESMFMGISGRMVDGIFIAYPDLSSHLSGSSPPLYIIPSSGVSDKTIEQVAGWSMVQVHVNAFSQSELLDSVASGVLSQFEHSKGFASIRSLPNRRLQLVHRQKGRFSHSDDSFRLSFENEYDLSSHHDSRSVDSDDASHSVSRQHTVSL